jgi:hypothetical protein
MLVAFSLVAVLLAGFGWFYRQILEPRQLNDKIEAHIDSLALRRPPELTRQQWESAVAWTSNLHGNSLLRFQTDTPALRQFEQRLSEKLKGKVNLETIDWIWAEYARACPGGANYQRFKPMMQDEIAAGGGEWGINVP